jgi:hypothetical protein
MTNPTLTEKDVAEIASKLTSGHRAALKCPPSWGLPVGHNQWFDLEYHKDADEDSFLCSGPDMEAIIRLELVAVGDREDEAGEHLIDEDRDVEARWKLDLSPLGLAVRNHLISTPNMPKGDRADGQ